MSSTFPAILAVHSGLIAAAVISLSNYVYVYLFVEKYEQRQINHPLAERIVIYVELVLLAVFLWQRNMAVTVVTSRFASGQHRARRWLT